MIRRCAEYSFLGLVYVFFYLPIVVMIAYSFNDSTFSVAWQGFTLQWYRELIHDTEILQIMKNSLVIAFVSSTLACIIGSISAVAIYRYRFKGRQFLSSLIFVLIVVPDLVFGIALLMFYHTTGLPLGFLSLLLAHITFCLPFVMVTLQSRLSNISRNMLEAAQDLGASDFIIFKRVIIPNLLPSLIAAWLLSLTLSLDDVMISFFVSGPSYQILPLYIYSKVRTGVTPEINALCTLLLVFTVVCVFIANRFNRGK